MRGQKLALRNFYHVLEKLYRLETQHEYLRGF